MPYAILEKKLQAVPEQYFEQVSSFLDLILNIGKNTSPQVQAEEMKPSGHPVFGLAKGKYKYPDDINAFDDEVAELFGV